MQEFIITLLRKHFVNCYYRDLGSRTFLKLQLIVASEDVGQQTTPMVGSLLKKIILE